MVNNIARRTNRKVYRVRCEELSITLKVHVYPINVTEHYNTELLVCLERNYVVGSRGFCNQCPTLTKWVRFVYHSNIGINIQKQHTLYFLRLQPCV